MLNKSWISSMRSEWNSIKNESNILEVDWLGIQSYFNRNKGLLFRLFRKKLSSGTLKEYNFAKYLRTESIESSRKYPKLRLLNMCHSRRKNLVRDKVRLKIRIVQLKLIKQKTHVNLRTNPNNTIIFYKCLYGT